MDFQNDIGKPHRAISDVLKGISAKYYFVPMPLKM